MDYFEIEKAAKAAFKEQYPEPYLRRLENDRPAWDLAHLLWFAFANGYATATEKAGEAHAQPLAPK